MVVTVIVGASACSRAELARESLAMVVTEDELPPTCGLKWGPKPMRMVMTEEAGRKNAGVILGFWFGRGNVPVDDMRLAVSNVFDAKDDPYALTMLTLAFHDEEKAEKWRAFLADRSPHVRIEREKQYVIMGGAHASVDGACSQQVFERQLQKLADLGGQ